MRIKYLKAKHYTPGRSGHKLRYIVIHHWDDPSKTPSFDGVCTWFVTGGGNNSAHYVVEDGRAAQLVADTDTAWHAGNWEMNCESIGIECNPRCSEGDKRTVGELIRRLRAKYGPLEIKDHRTVSNKPTSCPGRYYPATKTLAPYLGRPGSFQNPTPTPTAPAAAPGKTVAQMATEVIQGKHGNGHAQRQSSLGVSAAVYAQVRAEVNRRLQ